MKNFHWPIWSLVAFAIAGAAVRTWLALQGCKALFEDGPGLDLAGVGFLVLGVLVVLRRPDNRIGWLAALIGFQLVGLTPFVSTYAECGQALALPGVKYAAWADYFSAPFLIITLFILLPHLFPSGRFLTWRWRFAAWLGVGAFTLCQLFLALLPGPLIFSYIGNPYLEHINPFGLPFLPAPRLGPGVVALEYSVMIASIFIAIASLIVRWRRAHADERQQIKWFAFFLGAVVTVYVLLFEFLLPIYLTPSLSEPASHLYNFIYVDVAVPAVFMGFPIVLAITIFKYRLYDIDIIIRRTISYTVLTGILVAIFFSAVALLQGLFNALVGRPDSPLITVLTTLTIAALFNPLRKRTQDWIDQRFYRTKYDAEKALAEFAAIARDEVDISIISARLLSVVIETVQPEDVQLLLKIPAERQKMDKQRMPYRK